MLPNLLDGVAPQNFNYLLMAAVPANGTSGTDQTVSLTHIRKIQIVEIPPAGAFSITPGSPSLVCGSTSPLTFTVNNNNNVSGVTNYTWNFGTVPNGWLLPGGTPAPATYSSGTTNTLPLTPVCGATPSNVSVTVTAGGNSYQTSIVTVSVSNPTLSISGNSSFCTGTSSYSINNLPCNASVSWSASPSGIVSLSCTSCSSTTLTKLADGVVTLTATITKTNACSSGTETKNITVTVGAPALIYAPGYPAFNLTGQRFNYGANGPGNSFSVCTNEYLTFTPYIPNGYTQAGVIAHQWSISGSYSSVSSLTQDYLNVTSASTHPSVFNFTYQYQNAYGWSPVYYGSAGTMNCDNGEEPFRVSPSKTPKEKIVKQDGLVSVFPNPVNDVLYISINSKDVGRVTVKLYNALGKEVKKVLVISPLTSINLSSLTKGIYFVQILDGQKITTHKVIKN